MSLIRPRPRPRPLEDIYRNSNTFADRVIDKTGNKNNKEKVGYASGLLGYRDYDDFKNDMRKYGGLKSDQEIDLLSETDIRKYIRQIFDTWNKSRKIEFENRLRIEGLPEILRLKFRIDGPVPWSILKYHLSPGKVVKLPEYCKGLVKKYEYDHKEIDESNTQSIFKKIWEWFLSFDKEKPKIDFGNHYLYFLVKESEQYILYLAGPCYDKDCRATSFSCSGRGLIEFGFSHSDIYEGEGDIIMAGEFKPIRDHGELLGIEINNNSGHTRPPSIEDYTRTVLEVICSDSFGCQNTTISNFKDCGQNGDCSHVGPNYVCNIEDNKCIKDGEGGGSRKYKKHKKKRKNNKKTKRRKPRSKVRSKKSKTKRVRKIR